MYVEKRKNGTFYLKESVYNPETKLPKNTSIYLGSNPIQAKAKLKLLTDDLALLEQIPDIQLYEIELNNAIKELQKLNGFQTEGVTRLIKYYLNELLNAQQFIIASRDGIIVLTADCPDCRFNKANHCYHFKQNISNGKGRYKDGKPIRCIASELGETELARGTIKLPRDFRD